MYSSPQILDVERYSEGLLGTYIVDNNKISVAYFDDNGKISAKLSNGLAYPFVGGFAIFVEKEDENDPKSMSFYGLIDKNGKILVPAKYYDIVPFGNGLAYIMNAEERGFIDTTGKFVFNLEKGFAGYGFTEGLSPISTTALGKFGFIDTTGKLVINYEFEEAGNFAEGLAAVFKDGFFGYINQKAQLVIDTKFDEASSFSENLAFVAENKGESIEKSEYFWALINKDGIALTDFQFSDFKPFSEGLAAVQENTGENKIWKYIDKKGKKINKKTYKFCGSYKNGKALVVTNDDKKMFIDKKGNSVFEFHKDVEAILDCRTNDKFQPAKEEQKAEENQK
jgi:hypothetical protein